jgi:hypothetical protein
MSWWQKQLNLAESFIENATESVDKRVQSAVSGSGRQRGGQQPVGRQRHIDGEPGVLCSARGFAHDAQS